MGTTNEHSMVELLQAGVCRSEAIVLIQTESVLCNAHNLLELYTALHHRIPIVPLTVEGGGYDFGKAASLLKDLNGLLPPDELHELERLLAIGAVPRTAEEIAEPPTVASVQELLSKSIPYLLSKHYNPLGSEAHLSAIVQDVIKTLNATKLDLFHHKSDRGALIHPVASSSTANTARTSNTARAGVQRTIDANKKVTTNAVVAPKSPVDINLSVEKV